ncbi:MAG: SocA family protein [Thiomargarita sp.]|nr:SocA family protein [Thiomargarita sp.]
MEYPFQFKTKKSLETILYIGQNIQQPTFYHIAKIMYFADKMHLEKCGRFICGDHYIAMKSGPVPSKTYNILKAVRDNSSSFIDLKIAKQAFIVDDFLIKPLRLALTDYFSESDLECLDCAIEQYKNISMEEFNHNNAWETVNENSFIELKSIVSTFKNRYLLDFLYNPCPE